MQIMHGAMQRLHWCRGKFHLGCIFVNMRRFPGQVGTPRKHVGGTERYSLYWQMILRGLQKQGEVRTSLLAKSSNDISFPGEVDAHSMLYPF